MIMLLKTKFGRVLRLEPHLRAGRGLEDKRLSWRGANGAAESVYGIEGLLCNNQSSKGGVAKS
jgi:hypothetical protein